VNVQRMKKQNWLRQEPYSYTEPEPDPNECPHCAGAGTRCYSEGPNVLIHRTCLTCDGTGQRVADGVA
jgi:DnaJ-class molecular chaperone